MAPLASVELMESLTGDRPIVMSLLLAIGLSALLASAGSWLWQRRPGSRDMLFGDLMLWGWVRRMLTERRLRRAARLLDGTAGRGAAGSQRQHQVETLERLARALDARDPYTHGHSKRVARNAHMIASKMGLTAEQVAKVRVAGGGARRGEDLDRPVDPEQAERPDRRGVRGGQAPPGRQCGHARSAGGSGDRGDGAPSPRAARRQRLSGRTGGRRDSAGRADHRGGRHVRRDHLGAALPVSAQAAGGSEDPQGGGGHQARRRGGRGVPHLLLRSQDGGLVLARARRAGAPAQGPVRRSRPIARARRPPWRRRASVARSYTLCSTPGRRRRPRPPWSRTWIRAQSPPERR